MKKLYVFLLIGSLGVLSACDKDKSELCTSVIERAAFEKAKSNYDENKNMLNCIALQTAALKLSQKFESCELARQNNEELVSLANEYKELDCIPR